MIFGVDSALALTYLLCLQDVAASEECFNNIPLTEFTCRAALLCFALHHLRSVDPTVVHLPPHQVINAMKKIVQDPNVQESAAVKLFTRHVQYEEQFSCIEQLKRFECGVDVRRFITDPIYREDTVLGLAMSDSGEMLSLALFLADKYNLDVYQIVKQHAMTLLIGSNAPQKLHFWEFPGVADEAYEKDKYDKFRLQSGVRSAIEYARESNARAVEYILTFHGEQVLPYWLHFLDNFPEICDPKVYKDLLPECSSDGTPHTWEQKNLRDKDWCELKWGSYIEDIDITEPPILEYTKEIIMNWYEKRVKAVVERSGLVEVGIELVKIALDKNIGGLDALHCDLLTLESIVFSYEDELSYMTLEQLQNIEPAKRMILLTSKKEHVFLSDLTHKIIPYLERMAHLHGRDFKKSLVLNYFKQLSVDSIVYLYLFTKRFNWRLLCEDANDLSSVVIASVLACRNNEPEQYERINQTLALVTNLDVSVEMLGRLKHMDAILACSNILQRYNIDHTWEFVYKNRTNPDTANEILNKVVASIETNMSPFNIQFVHNLLEDLRLLQARLFQCVPVQDVYRKYVHGLLLSKNIYAIQHCESIISTSARDRGSWNFFFCLYRKLL
ncbi:neuroblastoma-amplified sequence-like [Diaphorina citri]|uniref:Neuroblastoma-amplified sequence-like n=1 Tax=Diaphorina citri TaxID=121845 RepID=A0A3Q0JG34_DIACI|nr:neuroblastoma-amplified sequence-like [Diaphorina citri]